MEDSAVGPDGIPHSAYSAIVDLSAQILQNTTEHFARDDDIEGLEIFNKQFVRFAPKGEVDEVSIAVVRTAGNLRTIFGSNTDSKYIASGIADVLSCPTFAITPCSQRGFCQRRQLSLNVVDIDSYMRTFQ